MLSARSAPILKAFPAFTLAELLIALAILGVIATFTIPKVLQAQRDSTYNAIAKEAAGMIEGAFTAYKLNNTVTADTKPIDLTPYMNFVAYDSTSTIDHLQTLTTLSCNYNPGAEQDGCIKLHNGAILFLRHDCFGNTTTTNHIGFFLDPDGKVTDGTTDGPGKALLLDLFTDGRLVTYASIPSSNQLDFYCDHTNIATESRSNTPSYDPPWFSWN